MRIPRKTGLLLGCALGAVIASQPARAQSFDGTPTVVTGTASVFTAPGSTSVLISSSETVINWSTTDTGGTGAIDFQPAGTTAVFSSDPSLSDYTVLNRILPVDAFNNPTNATVAFNGTVLALLGNNPGGNIWFYSPTGIIAGPTAVFNVGSLILTTNDIAFVPDPAGSIYGPGGLVQFSGPAGSTGFVDVQPGAQINATGANAYVALVAPRVVQGGTVNVDGQAAYLAAEQVDMTINAGLFDFTLLVGTTDANGVVHTGITTGPASTDFTDLQRISMVALPKNDALTMLLSGSIGYTPAASVANEGSSVVLAAGFDSAEPSAVPGNSLGAISIGNATFGNAVTGYASSTLTVAPVAGTTAFRGDATLYGLGPVSVSADAGEQVIAAANLRLRSGAPGTGAAVLVGAQGTGLVDVAGTLEADASSGAAAYVTAPVFLDAAGGAVSISANGGTIRATDIIATAEALGAYGDSRGGIATGGTVEVLVDGGTLTTTASLNLTASALGGNSARDGGNAQAGAARVTVNAGTLNAGSALLESNGVGGAASVSAAAPAYQSGHGTGGQSRFAQNAGTSTIASLTIQSDGIGGGDASAATGTELPALAGNGTGGAAQLAPFGGSLTTTSTALQALGVGGNGTNHNGGGAASDGGTGLGGTATMQPNAGPFAAANLTLIANGRGGNGGSAPGGTDGAGGDGSGLGASAVFGAGAFTLGAVTVEATGTGGLGATGGAGTGGQPSFLAFPAAGPAHDIASLTIDASGYGGAGTLGAIGASNPGNINVSANASDPAATLNFTGDLTLTNLGSGAGPGQIAIAVTGAPLTIGGNIAMTTTRDVRIEAGQPLRALGNIDIVARALIATGLVDADGVLSITGTAGIDADRLASGGPTLLDASGGPGPIVVADLLSAGPVTARGQSIDIASSGGLTFAAADASGGPIAIETAGSLALASVTAAGSIALASSSGTIAATGPVLAGGAFSATAPGGVSFTTITSGAATQLTSGNGPVDVDTLISPGPVSASGRGVFISGSGPLTFATAVSTGQMAISATGNLAFASVDSDLALTLTSTAGSIIATGDVTGMFPNLTAARDIRIEGNVGSLGTLVVNAGGSFAVEGNADADDAQITADEGITMTSLRSGEITRLDASNGDILISELLTGGRVTARGNDVAISSSGSLLFDEARAFQRDVRIAAAGNLSIGEVSASDEILLEAGGMFTLSGTGRGVSIDVTSADIALDAGAALGVRGTTRDLTLRNGGTGGDTFIGGEAQAGNYSLDRNEAARMFADQSLTILADGDIAIGDIALNFGPGANIGTGGMLEISSPEEITITGDVALRTSSAGDTFRIDPRLIALRTDTGSISMFTGEGGGGTPQGRLELVGDRIVAATTANITQLDTMSDLDAISLLLGQPGGSGEPLSAGTIHIDATDALFVQNSGTSDAFADRRGFAASGFEIATGSSATQIAVNGRIITPAGDVTGLAVTPLVTINGAPAAAGGQFHPRSTINGCVIGANCAPEPDLPDLDLPTREDIRSPVPGEGGGSLFASPLIELAATDPLITPPLVDEPITGVGNDDLWEPRCVAGDEDKPCPEDDGRP